MTAFKLTPLTATGFATVHPKRQNISFGRWAMPVMVWNACHWKNNNFLPRLMYNVAV